MSVCGFQIHLSTNRIDDLVTLTMTFIPTRHVFVKHNMAPSYISDLIHFQSSELYNLRSIDLLPKARHCTGWQTFHCDVTIKWPVKWLRSCDVTME